MKNIRRQGRLRAHANLGILREAMSVPGLAQHGLIALGEVRECLISNHTDLGDCDSIELAVEQSNRDACLECLKSAGWEIQNAPSATPDRQVIVVNLLNHRAKVSLRLFGVPNLSQAKAQFIYYKGLGVMTCQGHAEFMRSKAARLLTRRDQFLFDIYRTRLSSASTDDQYGLDVSDLPLVFRLKGRKILG